MIPHRVTTSARGGGGGSKRWFRSLALILVVLNAMACVVRRKQLRIVKKSDMKIILAGKETNGVHDGGEDARDDAVRETMRGSSAPPSRSPSPSLPPLPPPPSPPAVITISPECDKRASTIQPHTEYAGDVVHWGDTNDQESVELCCMHCRMTKMCNVFVYNPETKKCWLKKQKQVYEDVEPGTMAKGDNVVWTSGTIGPYAKRAKIEANGVRKMQDIEESEKTKLVDVKKKEPSLPVGQETRKRECGSPAIDGYAHVEPTCLVNSTTNIEFDRAETSRLEQIAWIEKYASYDGLAVKWGIGHKAATAEQCAQKCREHVPGRGGGPFNDLPCNAFVWCDIANDVCFEPDAHVHTAGDCWLKFTEVPERVEINQRGANDDPFEGFLNNNKLTYKMRHLKAPNKVHWTSGILLPPGWIPSNGTLGPRAKW